MESPQAIPGAGTLVLRGVTRGLLAGAALACSYTSLVTTGFMILVATGAKEIGNPGALAVGSGVAAFAWIFAVFLGIIPAALFGALAGLLVGMVAAAAGSHLTPRVSSWTGFLVGSCLIVFLHLTLGPGLLKSGGATSPLLPYLFWIGGPSPFLLAGAAWIGWSLQRTLVEALWPWRRKAPTGDSRPVP